MRFLVDECAGPQLAAFLQSTGHDTFSVYGEARGLADEAILTKAFLEQRILVTADKDFGEQIFRQRKPHCGVILMRLADERPHVKIEVIRRLLAAFDEKLIDQFTVVSEDAVRIASSGL